MQKGPSTTKIILIRAPKLMSPILRKMFGIPRESPRRR